MLTRFIGPDRDTHNAEHHSRTLLSRDHPLMSAIGIVTAAEGIARKSGIARQTPRVSIAVKRKGFAKRPLGRSQLKPFSDWNDGQPTTELNFKFYRQATNKIGGISDETAVFLEGFF
jgi:hypothetical protein